MIALVTILLALPLGYFLKNRLSAAFAYATIYLWSYTFQTAYLTRGWADGQDVGFRRPADFGLDYGLVTAAIFIVGFGLVALGHLLGTRRRARQGIANLDPAPVG
jgi:hypothetical protein